MATEEWHKKITLMEIYIYQLWSHHTKVTHNSDQETVQDSIKGKSIKVLYLHKYATIVNIRDKDYIFTPKEQLEEMCIHNLMASICTAKQEVNSKTNVTMNIHRYLELKEAEAQRATHFNLSTRVEPEEHK